MDIQTILLSILGSGAVMGAVGFAFKKSVETALQARVDVMREDLRRQGELHAEQVSAYIEIVEIIYRIRNDVRELAESNEEWSRFARGKQLSQLKQHQNDFRKVLYARRVILPRLFFELVHELLSPLHEISSLLMDEQERQRMGKPSNPDNLKRIAHSFDQVNAIYQGAVDLAQDKLGVKEK